MLYFLTLYLPDNKIGFIIIKEHLSVERHGKKGTNPYSGKASFQSSVHLNVLLC